MPSPAQKRRYLHGPRFVGWLERRVGRDALGRKALDGVEARSIQRYRQPGAAADVFTADRILVKLGIPLSKVPDDLYLNSKVGAR